MTGEQVPDPTDREITAAEERLTAELRLETGNPHISVKLDRNPLRPDRVDATVIDPSRDDFFGRVEVEHSGVVAWADDEPISDEQRAEFADVIEQMRAAYRPGFADHEVPIEHDLERVQGERKVNGGEHPDKLAAAGIIAAARHREPDPDPEPEQVTYLAMCHPCADLAVDVGATHFAPVVFPTESERDGWAAGHARLTGHPVKLATQDTGGTTLTGTHTGDTDPQGPPLVAFVVRHGAEPDLLCRIPDRAGAAWLMTAAYAVMLGRSGGSLGIATPHRVMYVGRTNPAVQRAPEGQVTNLTVRIDGVLGATGPEFADPIGQEFYVDDRLDPATAEDVIETLISRQTGLGRNVFGVILVADVETAAPADPDADALVREQRAQARRGEPWDFTVPDGQTVADMPDREIIGQALGGASACWENLRGAGVFDSTRAGQILDTLVDELDRRKPVTGRATPPDGALIGVPEPEITEVDRNARAYGWEIGHRNIEPVPVIEQTTPENPFLDPQWRDSLPAAHPLLPNPVMLTCGPDGLCALCAGEDREGSDGCGRMFAVG